jgi:hypothetical protein
MPGTLQHFEAVQSSASLAAHSGRVVVVSATVVVSAAISVVSSAFDDSVVMIGSGSGSCATGGSGVVGSGVVVGWWVFMIIIFGLGEGFGLGGLAGLAPAVQGAWQPPRPS